MTKGAAFLALVVIGALGAPTAMAFPPRLDGPDTLGPLDLRAARLTQHGPALEAVIRLSGPLDPRRLGPGSGVCLDLGPRSACVHRVRRGIGGYMRPPFPAALSVEVLAAGPRRIVLRVPLRAAGLRPGAPFHWSVRSVWRADPRCLPACGDRMPDSGDYPGQTSRFRLTGCSRGGRPFRSAGNRHRREVALTFDDGPGPYTARIIDVLERHRVPATFFVVGRQVRAYPGLLRRALADGFALGNHTWTHPNVARDGPFAAHQISLAMRAIRSATGYRPCLFRAPYGAVSRALVVEAARAALTTVGWNADPLDWSRPGAGAIYRRIMSRTRPGSIILMHDGGGPRGQTLAALPRVIRSLRARGYSFVTVPELLGFRSRYHYRPGVRPRGAPTRLRSDGARPLR